MNKIIITIAILGCLLYGNTTLDQNIKNRIEILDNESEYEISRELLSNIINNDNKIDAMNFWLELDKKILYSLNYNIHTKRTIISKTITLSSGLTHLWDLIAGAILGNNTNKKLDLNKIIYIRSLDQNINLIAPEKVHQTLNIYNELKKSQQIFKMILNNYLKTSNKTELNTILAILKSYNDLKNKIKKQRTNFVSYSVISPYLAESYRKLSYKDGSGYLQESARLMAKGVYNDILLESKEDVRNQFYNVYSLFKRRAGDKELEDLKVLQTLMNSSSKQKQNGADKWWE